MFMGAVSNAYKRLDVYLYKHVDTRRYLNLDVVGHAYAYLGPVSPTIDATTGGRYRRFRSLRDAIDHVGFWEFEGEPRLYRSLPPEAWPPVEGMLADHMAYHMGHGKKRSTGATGR
jgi:hypothetical protein